MTEQLRSGKISVRERNRRREPIIVDNLLNDYTRGWQNMKHSDDDWCTPGMREAPFYHEGMTPQEYDDENKYLSEHFSDLQNGTYIPLYKQNDYTRGLIEYDT